MKQRFPELRTNRNGENRIYCFLVKVSR